jgi:hypothetical protein
MSKVRFGFVVRNLIIACLLSGMALSLTACPESTAYMVPPDRADNNGSSDGSSGGRY